MKMHAEISLHKKLKLKGFYVEKLVGKGAFASVYECRKNCVKKRYAAKVVALEHIECTLKFQTDNEIEILKDLNSHRHVVRLHAVLHDSDAIVQILEFIPGCTLMKGILQWPRFSEQNLKSTMKQLLSALAYCHSKRIVHRDVCPENIMWYQLPTLRKPHQSPVLKLIDFNLAKRLPENSKMIRADPMGNPSYMAPECLEDKPLLSFCSDIWSVGVIAFTLMVGYPPFFNNNYNHLIANITEANYVLPDQLCKHISLNAKDMIKRALCKDMLSRQTALELLNTEWLQESVKDCNEVWIGHSRLKSFLKYLEGTRNRNANRKYTLTITERKPFIPSDAMLKELHSNTNDLDTTNNELYYHW